jgi:hypothetical protein
MHDNYGGDQAGLKPEYRSSTNCHNTCTIRFFHFDMTTGLPITKRLCSMTNNHGTTALRYFNFTLFSYQLHSAVTKLPVFTKPESSLPFPEDTANGPNSEPVKTKP